MDDNAIKTISKTDEEMRVGNYIVMFGGIVKTANGQSDLTGERFVSAPLESFESDYTKTGFLHVDWEHGLDPDNVGNHKDVVLGYVDWKTAKIDDKGIFVERVLNRRNQYMQYLESLIDAGLIGNSSEAAEYKKSKEGDILEWRLKRDSLTVMPAEPRMMTQNVITAMKSLGLEVPPSEGVTTLDDEAEGGQDKTEAQESKGANIKIVEQKGVSTMSDNTNQTPTPEYKALEDKINALSGGLEKVLKHIEDAPAVMNSGYVSQDGGSADSNIKSFGDFLFAVKRGDHTRLAKIYGATKALNEDQGSAGGYVVPSSFSTDLMQIAYQASPILGLVKRTPVTAPSGSIPALDMFVAPTAGSGNTAMAGKVTSAKRAEGGAFTATQPQFTEIKYRLNDVASGYVPVTKEFQADTPLSLESLLTSLFGIAVAAKQEYYILRGTGNAEPLGILNSAAAIGITPDTNNAFAYADAVEMTSRFKQITGNVRWLQHQSIMPDYAGAGWVQGQVVRTISDLGYGEAVMSEHLPQADNSGCVGLFDFGAYMLFEKGGLEISYSEHADFLNGNNVWRFSQRMDGQPWLKNVITLADPQGSFTVSPFVYFND